MLSTLHLGGRNSTGTEIKLSKILIIFAPYPPQIVRLWFQGNGSHVARMVRQFFLFIHSQLSIVCLPVTIGTQRDGV
jgi:hypothetical protein